MPNDEASEIIGSICLGILIVILSQWAYQAITTVLLCTLIIVGILCLLEIYEALARRYPDIVEYVT